MSTTTNATRNTLLGVLVIGVLLVGIVGVMGLRQSLNAPTATPTPTALPAGVIPLAPPRILTDFTLPDNKNKPLRLSDLQGKYTLLFFGYTHCPDFCPLTLAHWKSIKAALGDTAAKVNFLFISVDGERDTPEVLDRYLSRFDPTFIGMSGDDATLTRIAPDYGLYYLLHKEAGANYSVDHTTQTYLLDAQGRMIDEFDFDTAQADVVATIQHALAHPSA